MSAAPDTPAAPAGILRTVAAGFRRSPAALIGLVTIVIIVLSAIFAHHITPQNPYDLAQLNLMDRRLPPGSVSPFDDMVYYLGTDGQGRDILSAIIYGLRTSLIVGIGSALLAGTVGASVGLLAGYAGGRVDNFLMRVVDLQLSFPTVLVALMILSLMGKGVVNVVIALVIVEWAFYARTVRGSAVVEREREYVQAAQGLVIPGYRLLFRHILPNCMSPLIVIATIQVARAITLEATLSFLGLGVPPTEPSLGLLISNGYGFMFSGDYWISVYPGVALLITIVAINLVGDRMRDILNPRLAR